MLIGDVLQEVVDTLTTAGLAASTEPAELDLPGAWIVPGQVDFKYLSGEEFDITIDIYLLTVNNGAMENLNTLQDMLLKVRSVYNIPNAEFISLPIGTSEPVPAILISLQANITKD